MPADYMQVELREGTLRVTRHYDDVIDGNEIVARYETGPPTWTLDGEPITPERAADIIRQARRHGSTRDEGPWPDAMRWKP